MKGWQIGVVAVAGIAAVGAAGAPFVIGMQAERSFSERLAALSQGTGPKGLKVELKSYHRGWLGAEAVSEVTVPGESARIELVHTITHGPFLASRSLFEVSTQPRLTGPDGETARFYFGERGPLAIGYRMGFDGLQVVTLAVPAYTGPLREDPKTHVAWQGLSGELRITGDHVGGSFQSGGLGVQGTASNDKVDLTGIAMRVDADRRDRLWAGNFELTVDKAAVPGSGADKLRFSGFQRVESGRVAVGWSGDAAGITVEGKQWGHSEYAAELTNLDAAVLADFQARTEAIGSRVSGPAAEAELQRAVMELGPRLLAGNPRFAITRLKVETPSGAVTGKLEVAFKGKASVDPSEMLKGVAGSAEVSVPRLLAEQVATAFYRNQLGDAVDRQEEPQDGQQEEGGEQASAPTTPEQLDSMAKTTADGMLQDLIAQSMLAVEGEMLASRARLDGGKLYVNGQMLMDLAGGVPAASP